MCLAVPGQVVNIGDDALRTGTISFGGMTKHVSLALVPEARVGDYVIVHVGFAISTVDEDAALRAIELFKAMAAWDRRDTVSAATASEGTP
jgi:hydrogenase expression/formation protein HypC